MIGPSCPSLSEPMRSPRTVREEWVRASTRRAAVTTVSLLGPHLLTGSRFPSREGPVLGSVLTPGLPRPSPPGRPGGSTLPKRRSDEGVRSPGPGQMAREFGAPAGGRGFPPRAHGSEVAGAAGVGQGPRRLGVSSRPPPPPSGSRKWPPARDPGTAVTAPSPAPEACGPSKARGPPPATPEENARPRACVCVHTHRLDACLRAHAVACGQGAVDFHPPRRWGPCSRSGPPAEGPGDQEGCQGQPRGPRRPPLPHLPPAWRPRWDQNPPILGAAPAGRAGTPGLLHTTRLGAGGQ